MAVDDATTTTTSTGELAWHARRKAWTTATDDKLALQNARAVEANAWFDERLDDQKHLLGCYDHLIVRRKESVKPIPLKFAVKVIVQGWKRDGTWPEGMEAPVSTDPNDF
ncbi:hypothetical protein BDB00DRAFT_867926 [Zychaea mexicana]|uniref:uncharacterized protein n=1 Tax=Zychaea mexicana TaxID=64656 RepID=UPI0022FEA8E6|nr:uncharacterized protein BDB00DRAFT_867926 [Zychaea mexicana]KAI9497795.1 hypothetical protein BDB00DRAFT_867926 [Zychaea mexicana]